VTAVASVSLPFRIAVTYWRSKTFMTVPCQYSSVCSTVRKNGKKVAKNCEVLQV